MDFEQNFDNLSESTREFLYAEIDSLKLYAVEYLALLSGEIVTAVVLAFLLTGAGLFFLLALLVALSSIVGLLYSCLIVGAVLLVVATVVYLCGRRLLVDMFVGRFCKIFFSVYEDDRQGNAQE